MWPWAGVAGSPITHSLSPVLHLAAYAELGLDWDYGRYELDVDDLDRFVAERIRSDSGFRGLSITMPLKHRAFELADDVVGPATLVEAANTWVLDEDRLVAHNTDIPGMVRALAHAGVTRLSRAVVVGGGATAASTVAALADLGLAEVFVVVRNLRRTAAVTAVADRLGIGCRPVQITSVLDGSAGIGEAGGADIVVSTLPGGALSASQAEAYVALVVGAGGTETARGAAVDGGPADAYPARGVVFDLAYDPWPTPLMQAVANRGDAGLVTITGLDQLLQQAVLQVELMTGQPAPPARMAAALHSAAHH